MIWRRMEGWLETGEPWMAAGCFPKIKTIKPHVDC